ncbi:MAG: bestrophin family ion channel [Spirochaetota bacterium]
MYTKYTYRVIDLALWTRFATLNFFVIILAWVCAYQFLPIQWLRIPWSPIALIGTAVAFVIGFQNNAAYSRIWEARKIWGGIVNTSRTFGMYLQDMLTNEGARNPTSDDELKKEIRIITYRHIAWLTALRYAMRSPRSWEIQLEARTNQEWQILPPEKKVAFHTALEGYIEKEDLKYLENKNNKQTALLYLQSHHLRKLKEMGIIWRFAFLKLEGILEELFTLQGKSERIKNFPYPRQYATLNRYFMLIFILLLPIALVPQFLDIGSKIMTEHDVLGKLFHWLSIPVYVSIAWIFHTMERIGRSSENPFEGISNDVPISTIARGIEIDLLQNLGEAPENIPEQFPENNNVQF